MLLNKLNQKTDLKCIQKQVFIYKTENREHGKEISGI